MAQNKEDNKVKHQIIQAAQEIWPQLDIEADAFLVYLQARLPDGAGFEGALKESFPLKDLTLAWACSQGQARAIELFQENYDPIIDKALARLDSSHTGVQDVSQMFYKDLFTGQPQHPAKIGQYNGSGKLANWIRVVVVRLALAQQRKYKKEVVVDDQHLADLNNCNDDPEMEHLKTIYRRQFKQAFQNAFSQLQTRQRNLLRYQLLEQISLEQIGAIYQVNKSTVSRWIDKIRATLFETTKKEMSAQLRIDQNELQSIIHFIQSNLEVSMQRILEEENE
jgi:RNA polymerase sigma-70 factor (ECF subfamily)